MEKVIGIDEVGRGPIAGPVAVCAFHVMEKILIDEISKFTVPLRDSKKLSPIQREKWYEQIILWQEKQWCEFAVTYIDAQEIDKFGISRAIKKALNESIFSLNYNEDTQVLLDGGLRAPLDFKNQKTIIKGDEKEFSIALASIVAKVSRDRLMMRMAKRYPKYHFEDNMGYGTEAHYTALKKYGLTPVHRKSFLRNINRK